MMFGVDYTSAYQHLHFREGKPDNGPDPIFQLAETSRYGQPLAGGFKETVPEFLGPSKTTR
jgi:hypothetical protein